MREILFRGKRMDNCKWIVGDLRTGFSLDGEKVFFIDDIGSVEEIFLVPECHVVEIFPNTIGQYTGLTDKNGNKIFEGDICRFREWSEGEMCWIGKVHWEHQQFMISGGRNKECETMFELCMSRFIPENIEVIGNIHDNPELLKGGADNG